MSWLTSPEGRIWMLFLIRLYPAGMTFLADPRQYSIMCLEIIERLW